MRLKHFNLFTFFQPEEVQMQNMSLYGGNPQQAMYAPHGNHMVN